MHKPKKSKLSKLEDAKPRQADAAVTIPPIPGSSYLTGSGEFHAVFPWQSVDLEHLKAVHLDSKGHASSELSVVAGPQDTYTFEVPTGPETAAMFTVRNVRVTVALAFTGFTKRKPEPVAEPKAKAA
jgi:hypothetical protein